MNLLLRVTKLFLFILIMMFFIFILTYSIFIFKPDLALNTSNKLGLTDYKINFEEIDSNKNLLNVYQISKSINLKQPEIQVEQGLAELASSFVLT